MVNRFLLGLYLGEYDVDPPIGKVLLLTLAIIIIVVASILLLVECTSLWTII